MCAYWEKRLEIKTIPPLCLKRIQRDIMDITQNPPGGIFVLPDEENMRKIRVLITGPQDSGYHGGMFSFLIGFTNDYPMQPPLVNCLTAAGRRQLHPHINVNGSLCLSILGSMNGPMGWSPVMTLSHLTLTLQSFLSDKPYHHVKGYNPEDKESVERYNILLQHETIKVAVIEVMENINTYQEYFVEKIKTIFNEHYDHYINICTKNMHLDGKIESYPFGGDYVFEFKKLLGKIESIKQHLV